MGIRGDLRDVIDELIEHKDVCVTESPTQCDFVEMHIRELVAFMEDQPHDIRYRLYIILREAAERGWH